MTDKYLTDEEVIVLYSKFPHLMIDNREAAEQLYARFASVLEEDIAKLVPTNDEEIAACRKRVQFIIARKLANVRTEISCALLCLLEEHMQIMKAQPMASDVDASTVPNGNAERENQILMIEKILIPAVRDSIQSSGFDLDTIEILNSINAQIDQWAKKIIDLFRKLFSLNKKSLAH